MIADVAIAIKVAGERGHEGLPEEEDFTEAREQALTMNFILGAHPRYSGKYLMHLRNSRLEGNDFYPTTIAEAYNTLSRQSTRKTVGLDGREGVKQVRENMW